MSNSVKFNIVMKEKREGGEGEGGRRERERERERTDCIGKRSHTEGCHVLQERIFCNNNKSHPDITTTYRSSFSRSEDFLVW